MHNETPTAIGGTWATWDTVTVTYRNGHYSATARRDKIRATVRMSYRGDLERGAQVIAAAWRARVAMAEKFRVECDSLDMAEIGAATYADWTDPARYVAVVSDGAPRVGYIVTFVERDAVARVIGGAQ